MKPVPVLRIPACSWFLSILRLLSMRVFSKGKVGIEIDRASRPVSMLVLILV